VRARPKCYYGGMGINAGKVLLIANPAAQRGNGAAAAELAHRLLDECLDDESQLEFKLTEAPGHAIEIAAATDAQTVITLGGDGVIHETVNGLMRIPADRRPAFGLIPVGSGNDYARTLNIPEDIHEAVTRLANAQETPADLGCCNGEYFTETLSFGLDAAIALDTIVRRERTGQQGTILYAMSGIDQLLHHLETFHVHAVLDDGRVLEDAIHMFAIQVGPTYGGGFRICPDARIDDGLFDLCYASAPMSVPEATVKFLSAKNAHHLRWKNIHFDRASKLEITFDRRPPCQIDGEPHVADSYSVSIAPAALRVLMG